MSEQRPRAMTRPATPAIAGPLTLGHEQRPRREQDPRVRRSLILALVSSALLVAGGLGLVAIRVEQVELTYRVDALRAERARAEQLQQQLAIEIATLQAPGRVESRARQLGMVEPGRDQVRLAREFVPTVSGTAAASLTTAEALVR